MRIKIFKKSKVGFEFQNSFEFEFEFDTHDLYAEFRESRLVLSSIIPLITNISQWVKNRKSGNSGEISSID